MLFGAALLVLKPLFVVLAVLLLVVVLLAQKPQNTKTKTQKGQTTKTMGGTSAALPIMTPTSALM